MKFRNGFVSNSSSSSFVCDICGEEQIGMDLCLSEAEMYQCENGHTVCESSCIKGISDIQEKIEQIGQKELIKTYIETYINKNETEESTYIQDNIKEFKTYLNQIDKDELDEDELNEILDKVVKIRYNLPASCCPICLFEVLDDSDVSSYILKKLGQTKDELKKEIKLKFNSFDEFQTYLKGKDNENT